MWLSQPWHQVENQTRIRQLNKLISLKILRLRYWLSVKKEKFALQPNPVYKKNKSPIDYRSQCKRKKSKHPHENIRECLYDFIIECYFLNKMQYATHERKYWYIQLHISQKLYSAKDTFNRGKIRYKSEKDICSTYNWHRIDFHDILIISINKYKIGQL